MNVGTAGIEPARITATDLKTVSLATRTSTLVDFLSLSKLFLNFPINNILVNSLGTAGIEPARITATDLKTVSLATRTSTLFDDFSSVCYLHLFLRLKCFLVAVCRWFFDFFEKPKFLDAIYIDINSTPTGNRTRIFRLEGKNSIR